jgi:hypothetical protein
MSESAERVCTVCEKEIPKWKAKNATCGSFSCKTKRKKQWQQNAAPKRKPESMDGSVLHTCLANALDPVKPSCRCKKQITDDEGKSLVAKGGAVNFKTRLALFVVGDPILLVGRSLRTPRSATIERSHIEKSLSVNEAKQRADFQELKARQAETQRLLEEEWEARMDVYGELNQEFLKSLIVEVPAERFDRERAEAFGRPGIFSFVEERGSVGRDVLTDFDEPESHGELENNASNDANEGEDQNDDEEDSRTAEELLSEFEEKAA